MKSSLLIHIRVFLVGSGASAPAPSERAMAIFRYWRSRVLALLLRQAAGGAAGGDGPSGPHLETESYNVQYPAHSVHGGFDRHQFPNKSYQFSAIGAIFV